MYTPINVLRLARDGIKKLDQVMGGEDEVTTGIMATEQPVAETDPLVDTIDALDEAYSEVPGYRSVRTQAEPQSDVDARVYSMWRVGEVPVESPGVAMRSLVRFNPTSSMMGRMAQSRISDAVEEGTFTRNEDKEPETGLERFLDDPLGSVANFFFPPAGAQTEDDGLTAFLEQQPGVGVEFEDAPQGLMSPPAARPEPTPEYVDPDEGRSRLDIDLDTIMVSEGGFQQDVEDSGNYVGDKLIGTNRGITPVALAKYRGIDAEDVTVEMMKEVTDAEAREIFKQDYYYRPKIDQLPENIQDTVFDMYINSGSNAIKILQRMVGATPDGVIGPQTLAAVADANITRDAYADARIEFYKSISKPGTKNAKYRQGWINRANKYRD